MKILGKASQLKNFDVSSLKIFSFSMFPLNFVNDYKLIIGKLLESCKLINPFKVMRRHCFLFLIYNIIKNN